MRSDQLLAAKGWADHMGDGITRRRLVERGPNSLRGAGESG